MKIRIVMTGDAFPEQYEAYLGEEKVAYLRMRHGHFTVSCPDVTGIVVYEGLPEGDGWFMQHELDYWLRFGVDAIHKWIAAGRPTEPPAKPEAPQVEYDLDLGVFEDSPWIGRG